MKDITKRLLADLKRLKKHVPAEPPFPWLVYTRKFPDRGSADLAAIPPDERDAYQRLLVLHQRYRAGDYFDPIEARLCEAEAAADEFQAKQQPSNQ